MTEPTLDTPTRCWPRIVLITLLYSLVVVTSASAECAWVLWSSSTLLVSAEPGSKKWELMSAWQTMSQCLGAAKGHADNVWKASQSDAARPGIDTSDRIENTISTRFKGVNASLIQTFNGRGRVEDAACEHSND